MEVDEKLLAQLQQEAEEQRSKNVQLGSALASSSFQGQQDNLISYQLDSGELLNRIERFLKGEYLSMDEQGNEFWKKPEDENLILFNEYGVGLYMDIINNYIDKNTFLSFYSEERIYEILYDLGIHLNYLIFCNYEMMGMGDKKTGKTPANQKRTRYPITVVKTLHMIETSYRRAIRGITSERINTATIVTQSDMVGNRMPSMGVPKMSMKRKFNLFRPATW